MSEQKRRRYDAEFKRNAIALSEEPGRSISEVEQSLGISPGLIYKWKNQFDAKGTLAFPGNGIEALTPDQKKIRELEKKLRDAEIDREILKKAVAIFSKNTEMKYIFIKTNRSIYSVLRMCRNLQVSVSGYYDWKKRKKSNREHQKDVLKMKIREFFYEKHGEMAGSHLITHDLHDFDEFKHVNRLVQRC